MVTVHRPVRQQVGLHPAGRPILVGQQATQADHNNPCLRQVHQRRVKSGSLLGWGAVFCCSWPLASQSALSSGFAIAAVRSLKTSKGNWPARRPLPRRRVRPRTPPLPAQPPVRNQSGTASWRMSAAGQLQPSRPVTRRRSRLAKFSRWLDTRSPAVPRHWLGTDPSPKQSVLVANSLSDTSRLSKPSLGRTRKLLAVCQSPAVSDVVPVARGNRIPAAAVKELSGEPS